MLDYFPRAPDLNPCRLWQNKCWALFFPHPPLQEWWDHTGFSILGADGRFLAWTFPPQRRPMPAVEHTGALFHTEESDWKGKRYERSTCFCPVSKVVSNRSFICGGHSSSKPWFHSLSKYSFVIPQAAKPLSYDSKKNKTAKKQKLLAISAY